MDASFYPCEILGRLDIKRIDLLIPSATWRQLEPLVKRRMFSFAVRYALGESLRSRTYDWVAKVEAGNAARSDSIHRISVELPKEMFCELGEVLGKLNGKLDRTTALTGLLIADVLPTVSEVLNGSNGAKA